MIDYDERHGKYAAAAWHRRFLQNAYRRNYLALAELDCDPLAAPGARVLQCGIGAPATLEEFATFVDGRQPSASLVVVDLRLTPLTNARAAVNARFRRANVSFAQADARALPFADESFDLVETDFLLQFLAPADRRATLEEFARVLTPGGGLMTRDWMTRQRGLDTVWDGMRRAVLRTALGVQTHVLGVEDLRSALSDGGYRATVVPLGRLPLIHLVAAVASDRRGRNGALRPSS